MGIKVVKLLISHKSVQCKIWAIGLLLVTKKINTDTVPGQVRSECLTCTFRASCCSARLSRAQVPAFAVSSVRDRYSSLPDTQTHLYRSLFKYSRLSVIVVYVRWVFGSIPHGGPIEISPVPVKVPRMINKGRGLCYPVCFIVIKKYILLLIGKSSSCSGGSGFPLPLSGLYHNMSDDI